MVNLHKCHSGRKESKSWVVRGVQQQGPLHSELGWDGYFYGHFESIMSALRAFGPQFLKSLLTVIKEWGTRLVTVSELGYLKRIENWMELVIWFIMVCGTSQGQPTVNGCSYPHRHVTAPMTQLDNTTTGGISISVVTSKLTYVIATHSHINTESPPNTHIQVLSETKKWARTSATTLHMCQEQLSMMLELLVSDLENNHLRACVRINIW